MSTLIPNHPVVADIIIVAKILSFNNLWLCSINWFVYPYALIVLAPDIDSPKWDNNGDFVVVYNLTVSLIEAAVLLTSKYERNKIIGKRKAIHFTAKTATTIT